MTTRTVSVATIAMCATLRLVASPAPDVVVSRRPLRLSAAAAEQWRDRLAHARIEAITYLSDG